MNRKPIYAYLLFAVLNPLGVMILRITGWLCGSKPTYVATVSAVLSIIAGVLSLRANGSKARGLFRYAIPICGMVGFPILVSISAGFAKFTDSLLNKTWPFVWIYSCWLAQIVANYLTLKETKKS